MQRYKIAAIPADGIGPEVIDAGLEVLEALERRQGDFELAVTHFDWGSDYYRKTGSMMPEDGPTSYLHHAIFFGAVGAPDVPDHITLWGLRLPICQGFDQYANVRPTRILPGIDAPLKDVGPGDLDWVIIRENLKVSMQGTVAARIGACQRKSQPRRPSSPASVSSASCATHSAWRRIGHENCLQS